MSLYHFSCLNQNARKTLIEEIRTQILPHAPFFTPTLKSGVPFHYQMTNCGEWGWLSDRHGYRYTRINPLTGQPWPPLTPSLHTLIAFLKLQGYIPQNFKPETCLINKYLPGDKLGLHQDNTEENLQAPIVSLSLGAPGIFLLGGERRQEPTQEILLQPGDILILSGDERLRFHGFRGITAGRKRLNLTLRQVR